MLLEFTVAEPDGQQVAYAQQDLIDVDRLRDEVVGARTERGLDSGVALVGGEHENRDEVRRRHPAAQGLQEFDATDVGHVQIEEDEIGFPIPARLERVHRIGEAPYVGVSRLAQNLEDERDVQAVVIDDHDAGLRHLGDGHVVLPAARGGVSDV